MIAKCKFQNANCKLLRAFSLTYLRVSDNSQSVHEPFNLAIFVATSLVVTHEKLVGEDGRQNLCAVVVEASMPNAVIQFEEPFEPFVERFDCLAAACIQTLSFSTLEKLLARQASPMGLIARFRRLIGRRLLVAAAVFRAQKTPTRSLALLVVLDVLAQLIAVVTAVGQHIVGFLREFLDLVGKGLRFLRTSRIDDGWVQG